MNPYNIKKGNIGILKHLSSKQLFKWTEGAINIIFEEIDNLKSIDDIKDYIYKGLSELEDGIVNTYNKETKEAFEDFGKGIETRQLPLPNILKYINLENNINDFR